MWHEIATWLQSEHPGVIATEITSIDAKMYRDHLLAKRFAPTTINRALISLMLFFDTIDSINPFRHLTMIEIVEPAPVALSKTEWNAVRRSAEAAARRDHGLALALTEKQLLPGVAGRRDVSFSVSADLWPNAAFARSSPSLVRLQNSLHLSAPTTCAIRLLNPSLILLPMDWIAHQCRFRRFSNCSAMLTLQPRPSIPGSPLMILPV